MEADARDECASSRRTGDSDRQLTVGEVFHGHKNEHPFSVSKHFCPHLVHVEDEGRLDAVESLGERSGVEDDDVVFFNVHSCCISRDGGFVGVLMSLQVGGDVFRGDLTTPDVVSKEGHDHVHCDSAPCPSFTSDEVFQEGENITQFTSPSGSLGASPGRSSCWCFLCVTRLSDTARTLAMSVWKT